MFRKCEPSELISNGIVLRQESTRVMGLKIFGCNFFWPCPSGNPYYDQIPHDVDIVMAHGPAKGVVDGDAGCPSLREHLDRLKPKMLVVGHIHSAHGNVVHDGIECVNAAICKDGYQAGWEPIVVELTVDENVDQVVVNDDDDDDNNAKEAVEE
jgi:Icc-related predicted phosphoesterase